MARPRRKDLHTKWQVIKFVCDIIWIKYIMTSRSKLKIRFRSVSGVSPTSDREAGLHGYVTWHDNCLHEVMVIFSRGIITIILAAKTGDLVAFLK